MRRRRCRTCCRSRPAGSCRRCARGRTPCASATTGPARSTMPTPPTSATSTSHMLRKLVETSLSASTKRFEELPKGNEMLKRQSEFMTLQCNCTVPLNIFPFHFSYYWSEDVRMRNYMIVDMATV
uniref:Uncharacterized protein n=2 Tax=Aegilops tauschii subsp. strangulata TaxID=200361 RepID=A0A453L8Y2_AEGTS